MAYDNSPSLLRTPTKSPSISSLPGITPESHRGSLFSAHAYNRQALAASSPLVHKYADPTNAQQYAKFRSSGSPAMARSRSQPHLNDPMARRAREVRRRNEVRERNENVDRGAQYGAFKGLDIDSKVLQQLGHDYDKPLLQQARVHRQDLYPNDAAFGMHDSPISKPRATSTKTAPNSRGRMSDLEMKQWLERVEGYQPKVKELGYERRSQEDRLR